jgi:small ligand-binding sensory domain FIST
MMGINPDRNAVVVGALVQPYQAVQFHLRDAEASAEDLRQHLTAYSRTGNKPAGALLFSCLGRGEHLYGQPDHDSNLIINYLGNLPVGGFFCNGEIGPVGEQTFLHGYTSSFALLRPRSEPGTGAS